MLREAPFFPGLGEYATERISDIEASLNKFFLKLFCFLSKSDLLLLLPTQFRLNAMDDSFGQPPREHLVQLCTCIKLIFDCLSARMFDSGLVSLLSDLPPVE